MRCLAALLLASFLVAGILPAIEPVQIKLRGRIELASGQALLGDLADLTGPAEAVARLAVLPVQDLYGTNTFTVAPGQIRRVCTAQAPGISILVSGTAQVVQARRSIPVEAQVQAATAVVTAPGDDAEVKLVRANGSLVVGDDGQPADLRAEVIEPGASGEIPVRIRVMRGEREEARSLVVINIRRFRRVAVLVTDIVRGQPIGLTDVVIDRVEIVRALNDPLERGEDAVGLVAQRDLTAGTVLRRSQLSLPLAVRPGQRVHLVWRQGAIELAVAAECLAAGKVGETVTVRRLSDGQVVRAQVEASGQVAVSR